MSVQSSYSASASIDCAALKAAFTREGITVSTAELFLAARAAGLDWELATGALAEGLAERRAEAVTAAPRAVAKRPHASWGWRRVALAVGLYVLLRPLLGLGHELAVTIIAFVAHLLVGTGWWLPLITWGGLDPIYGGAAIQAVGGVEVLGLAVAAPVGDVLHAWAPAVFQAAQQVAPGAGVSMVAAPGTPALGRGLAGFGADVFWLTVGLILFGRWRQRLWPVALVGLCIQAQIAINHLFSASVSLPDLEASGLPYALALAVPVSAGDGWFTATLAQFPEWVQDGAIGGTLLLLGYTVALTLLATAQILARLSARYSRCARASTPAVANLHTGRVPMAPIGAAIAVVVAVSPIGALAFGQPNWQTNQVSATSKRAQAPDPAGRLRHSTPAGPSRVEIQQTAAGTWQYLVDGQSTVVRGVGYNPQYAGLAGAERAQLYQRDFSAMRRLGINTIEGWFETQFDSVTLDAAARDDVGVVMPFELNQDWPYENLNVQQSILDHVSAYVEKYKNSAAVRMWAPGNENLHRILYPHLVSKQNDPLANARADAFAAFLPVLVDRVHQLDPNHPVLYRDAEDVYLPRLKTAFEATGVQRPWLVYGANVYSSSRLQEIIARWPAQWIGGPLLISEFGPGGAGRADRPVGYQQDWTIIRARADVVLGGLAYTWATNGPEELDRVFGLVDQNAVPTDGALAALSAAYVQGP